MTAQIIQLKPERIRGLETYYKYCVEYEHKDKTYSFEFWAISDEDAEKRLDAIARTAFKPNRMLKTIPPEKVEIDV